MANGGISFRQDIGAFESQGVPGYPTGDHNHNGIADTGDYVLWRKTPASYGGSPTGYNTWRSNFGNTTVPTTPGAGAGNALAVTAAVTDPSDSDAAASAVVAGLSEAGSSATNFTFTSTDNSAARTTSTTHRNSSLAAPRAATSTTDKQLLLASTRQSPTWIKIRKRTIAQSMQPTRTTNKSQRQPRPRHSPQHGQTLSERFSAPPRLCVKPLFFRSTGTGSQSAKWPEIFVEIDFHPCYIRPTLQSNQPLCASSPAERCRTVL